MDLHCGDCLDKENGLAFLANESVDMILCDLPYGVTDNKWDVVLDLDALFKEYLRIIKPNCAIVLFAQQPFTTDVINIGRKYYKYDWIYEKSNTANFAQANKRPLKKHENILVFSKGTPPYFPQMSEGHKPYSRKAGIRKSASHMRTNIKENIAVENKTTRFPQSILHFKQERGLHTTQKPVALCEYLIKTYTQEKAVVLDNCMGSGTSGIACLNTNRDFIGWELDEKYFQLSVDRIQIRQEEMWASEKKLKCV